MMPPGCDKCDPVRPVRPLPLAPLDRRNGPHGAEPPDMRIGRRGPTILVAGALMGLALTPAAGAGPTGSHTLTAAPAAAMEPSDAPPDCDAYVPEQVKPPAAGPRAQISLDVVVLLDGLDKAAAEPIVAKVGRSYAPVNISITPTYKKVSLLTATPPAPSPTRATVPELLAAAKSTTGGIRPPKTDVVLVLTTKDLYMTSGDVVGYADCIGGVRYPDRAFALAEATDQPESVAGLNLYADLPSKTAAHELGHLLGARHEYANCVEGASADVATYREPSVCTLMTAYLDLQSRRFGTLEAGVIRAYAESYAAP